MLDAAGHLVLPTLAIAADLVRDVHAVHPASMLETMNQDYVRTARPRASPTQVVMRHAFRTALIPVTTLIGVRLRRASSGARSSPRRCSAGRGWVRCSTHGLHEVDPYPVMALPGRRVAAIVVFNMIADIAYAYLDPRIRLD